MLFRNIKTVDADWNVRENMYVATKGTKISYIGTRIPSGYEGEVYDGTGKFLIPGFYNTHCHVPMTFMRGVGGGLPLDRWLHEQIFPMEAHLTDEDVYYGSLLGASELLSSGVVSISDMYFRIGRIAEALEKIGLKGNLSNGVVAFDDSRSYFEDRSFQELLEIEERYGKTDGRIRADVSIHSEYSSTERVVREAADYAREKGKIIQIHVSETEKEHAECRIRHNGRTPVEYLRDCGVFDSPVIAAHCVQAEEKDLEIMKEHGAWIAHNVSSNLKLGSGIAPLREWLKKGIHVTLGTDGPSSNNNLNFLEEMHLAAMVASGASRDAQAVGIKDIFRMATREGALAQGREDCGEMAEGMRADLVVFDLNRPHLCPDYDTLANILYSAQSTDICLTMVDGKTVYKNGVFPGLDMEKLMYEVQKRHERLLNEAGLSWRFPG